MGAWEDGSEGEWNKGSKRQGSNSDIKGLWCNRSSNLSSEHKLFNTASSCHE